MRMIKTRNGRHSSRETHIGGATVEPGLPRIETLSMRAGLPIPRNGRQLRTETHPALATVEPGQLTSETQWRRAGLSPSQHGRHVGCETQESSATVEPSQSGDETHIGSAGLLYRRNGRQSYDETHFLYATVEPGQRSSEPHDRRAGLSLPRNGRRTKPETHRSCATVEQRTVIAELIARAKAKPTPLATIMAIRVEADGVTLADRVPGFPVPDHIMLGTYRVAFGFEEQPAGIVAHLSISVPTPGKLPSALAIEMIAEAFGLPDTLKPDTWLEEFDPGHHAVNVAWVMVMAPGPHGTA